MMYRLSLVLTLTVCVSAELIFTINRITKTKYETCTVSPTVAVCATARSLNIEVINPSKPEEIEMTSAPDFPRNAEEEKSIEYGELVFSSQETNDCFVPNQRNLIDSFAQFFTTVTSTKYVTESATNTATTVSIAYNGCVPADALSTTVCV